MPSPAPKSDLIRIKFEQLFAKGLRSAAIAQRLGVTTKLAHILCAAIGAQFPRPSGSIMRRCLTCRELFLSWGAGNRRCPPCKGAEDTHDGPV